ncbi:MAG: prolipoprotein diacylglyceryl transferase [Chloroflexota bacterium]
MVYIDIDPIALQIGWLVIRWYGVMMFLAIVTVLVVAVRAATRMGLKPDEVAALYEMTPWAVVGGLVVSRLFHVVDEWEYYSSHPAQIMGFAGLTIFGAVVGAVGAIVVYCAVKKVSFWRLGDAIAPGGILGQAVGRIGCILNGRCFGLPTSLSTAFVFTNPASAVPAEYLDTALYPTQLYHIIWNVGVFAVLWRLKGRIAPPGSVFLIYLGLYSIGDFIVRFFRVREVFLFNMPQAQVISIATLLAVTALFFVRRRQWKKSTASVPQGH